MSCDIRHSFITFFHPFFLPSVVIRYLTLRYMAFITVVNLYSRCDLAVIHRLGTIGAIPRTAQNGIETGKQQSWNILEGTSDKWELWKQEESGLVHITFRNTTNIVTFLTWVGEGMQKKDSKDPRNKWQLNPNESRVVPMAVNVRHKFFMINNRRQVKAFTWGLLYFLSSSTYWHRKYLAVSFKLMTLSISVHFMLSKSIFLRF